MLSVDLTMHCASFITVLLCCMAPVRKWAPIKAIVRCCCFIGRCLAADRRLIAFRRRYRLPLSHRRPPIWVLQSSANDVYGPYFIQVIKYRIMDKTSRVELDQRLQSKNVVDAYTASLATVTPTPADPLRRPRWHAQQWRLTGTSTFGMPPHVKIFSLLFPTSLANYRLLEQAHVQLQHL
ncbi:hypothetical protein CPB85DRAFT_694931 [Mucidula mucida]|nr:hypothetical protein CPB85DRAFT_694931 [Mucidula mucida]